MAGEPMTREPTTSESTIHEPPSREPPGTRESEIREPVVDEPVVSEPTTREPTIIQTLTGETFVTRSETPSEALARLSEDFVAQRLGNVVRLVYPRRRSPRDRTGH